MLSFVTTDPTYPIEAGTLTVTLPPPLEGNEYDVGFHPNQNTEPSTIIRAKPVPHQTWKISEDGRTATYIGPTVESGYGPPIPPAIFVKGFTAKDVQLPSRTEQQAIVEKNKKLQELKNSFKKYKENINVTFHGRNDLLEVIKDVENI